MGYDIAESDDPSVFRDLFRQFLGIDPFESGQCFADDFKLAFKGQLQKAICSEVLEILSSDET